MDWLVTPAPAPVIAAALLFLRLVVGVAFMLHGMPKLSHPMTWMNLFGMQRPAPGPLQALAALSEVGGGLAVLLGLVTRLGAFGVAATMVGALVTVHVPAHDPFVSPGRSSSELAVVYLAVAFLLMAIGPGPWSLDAILFG
jgi:putative oxidoreductase